MRFSMPLARAQTLPSGLSAAGSRIQRLIFRPMAVLTLLMLTAGPASAHSAHHAHAQSAGGPCAEPAAQRRLECARSPTAVFAPDGRLWLTWYGGGHVFVSHSDDQGRSFSPAVTVNPVPETVDDQGEDRPQIALGPEGEIYILWTRKLDKPYTGHIRFSRSLDGGVSFSAPIRVNDDDALIAHRFPSFKVNADGRIFVSWIDKRDLVAAKTQDKDYPGAALYYAVSDKQGEDFGRSIKLADNSCECCRIAMALDPRGQPLLFYRHVFPGQIRDHALIRFDNAGTPRPSQRVTFDDWRIEGCPHQGPAIAAAGEHTHLAWFTAGPGRQGLFYERIDAAGRSEPIPVGQAGAERATLAARGRHVLLAWKAYADGRTRVYLRRSDDAGRHWSAPAEIASTGGGSDHPLLIQDGHSGYLSWQTADEGYRLVSLEEK